MACLIAGKPGRGGAHFERSIGQQVRDVMFLLSGRSALADKPDLVARDAFHADTEHTVLITFRASPPWTRVTGRACGTGGACRS